MSDPPATPARVGHARLRLAVFDMIGTTVDADRAVTEAFDAAFARSGVTLTPREVDGVRGRSKRDAIARLLGAHRPEEPEPARLADEVHTAFQEGLRQRLERLARAVPGTDDVFAWLSARGVAIGLTTGLDRDTAGRLVHRLGWTEDLLAAVVTADDVERGRPAPDLIHLAMRRSGAPEPRAVLNVGDTVSDLASARAAGVGWSVGVLTGAHGRDRLAAEPHSVLLEAVADLPEWLTTVGALD